MRRSQQSYLPTRGIARGPAEQASPRKTTSRLKKTSAWRRALTGRGRQSRRLRVTREGWVFILVTLGVGAAAINTGNNLLFLVLGLNLGLIIISGVMSEITLRRLKIERKVPRRIHAGTPTLVEVTLHNKKKRLPSYSVEIEDLIDGWSPDKRCYFLKVADKSKQTAAYQTGFPRRGPLRFLGYRVATRFPFGLFEKWREMDVHEDVVVVPKLVKVPRVTVAQGATFGDLTRGRPGHGEDIHGLRDFRPGDDSRSIHWRSSARRGELLVREHEDERTRRLCIYLDNTRTEGKKGEVDKVVERAISLAASLATDRVSKGQSVHLAVRGGLGPVAHAGSSPDKLLKYLGMLEYAEDKETQPFGQLPWGEAVLVAPAPGQARRAGVFALAEAP